MIPVIVILVYLAVIASVGSLAYRRSKTNTEDFFLANRSVGVAGRVPCRILDLAD